MLYLRFTRRRRGAVAVLVAVCLTALVSIAAIALDGGVLLDERRHAQSTADAAALAAAGDLFKNYPTNNGADPNNTAQAAALAVAAANGYTNDGIHSLVIVNIPPASGLFQDQLGYAEVIVRFNQQRSFSRIFGAGDIPVVARAVARGAYSPFQDGILVLDRSTKGSLKAHGSLSGAEATINVTGNTSVLVNSTDPEGGQATGNGHLQANNFRFTGGFVESGGGTFSGPTRSGTAPVPDPLRFLPPPDPSTMPDGQITVVTLGNGEKSYTLTPGTYLKGLQFTGQDQVVMLPGIYYTEGGFAFSGGSLTATGVMIYNQPLSKTSKNADITITGNGSVTISPPTDGLYQGISIFQDRDADVPISIAGNGQFSITGTIYAANTLVQVTGNGDVSIGSQYISRFLDVGGNGSLTINYSVAPRPKVRTIQLVE